MRGRQVSADAWEANAACRGGKLLADLWEANAACREGRVLAVIKGATEACEVLQGWPVLSVLYPFPDLTQPLSFYLQHPFSEMSGMLRKKANFV